MNRGYNRGTVLKNKYKSIILNIFREAKREFQIIVCTEVHPV